LKLESEDAGDDKRRIVNTNKDWALSEVYNFVR